MISTDRYQHHQADDEPEYSMYVIVFIQSAIATSINIIV